MESKIGRVFTLLEDGLPAQVAKKVVSSQVTLFPPFIALLFGWLGALEVG